MTGFVHLHTHSYYSFFDSTATPGQIADFAVAQGMPAIALTDTNSFTGIVEFYLHCKEAGIQPILGAEVRQPLTAHRKMLVKRAWKYRSDDDRPADDFAESGATVREATAPLRVSSSPMLWHGDPDCRAVLLARSLAGYTAISHLLTRRHLEADFDLLNEVAALPDSLILLSDCPPVLAAARGGRANVYGELLASPRQRLRNRQVYQHCLAHHLPMVMTTDAKLLTADEHRVHNLLRAMGTLSTLDNLPPHEKIDPCQHLQTDAAVREFFMLDRTVSPDLAEYQRHLHDAWQNTAHIAEQCQCELPYRQWRFPRLKLQKKDPTALLAEMTWQGIGERYGTPPPDKVIQRTRHELDVIDRLGFTEYFLLVKQIIDETESRGLFTIGRGSAANSIVTYALRISNVCPVKYNLYFERFLNPDRSSPPDIDLDFSWRERDSIIDWCFEFFGRENVALISTVPTLKYRQAIREVAKAYGIPPKDVDAFNKLSETGHRAEEETGRITDYTTQEPWATILKVAERIQGFPHHLSVHCGGIVIAPMPVVDLMPLTLSAKGYAITQMDMLGVEDLGLMKLDLLGNRSLGVLKDIITEADRNGYRAYHDIPAGPASPPRPTLERAKIFKREAQRMKLEGTRRGTTVALSGSLDILKGDAAQSHELYHRPLAQRIRDFTHVTNDPWTRRLIDEGQTMGCFYIESPGMRALFERLRCQNYEEVVVASSIIRPGVASSGMMKEYIDRHQVQRGLSPDLRSPTTMIADSPGSERMAKGTLPINAHAKSRQLDEFLTQQSDTQPLIATIMQELLPETHGVMVYQEDVLRVAHELAGMTFAEADILRRAISGKLRSTENIMKIQERFLQGCRDHRGLPDNEAKEIWRQLSSFAGYSFCKGHSAAFAVLSYQIAYLKAHHPAEFFAAVLTNQGGFYGPGAYVEEARRWGIITLPPCVNESATEYRAATLCAQPVSGPVPVGDAETRGWIRPGLRFISGLTTHGLTLILKERERGGPFKSFHDFLRRCLLYDDEIVALIRTGACDTFFDDPPEAARASALLEASLFRDQHALCSDSLFAFTSAPRPQLTVPPVRPFTPYELCQHERAHIGFMISGHPLDFITLPSEGSPPLISASQMRQHARRTVRMIGWGIAAKVLSAKNNRKPMKMLTLEDRTGTFEATLFPRAYARLAPRTLTKGPYLVTGQIDIDLGSPTLNVSDIEPLAMKPDTRATGKKADDQELHQCNVVNQLGA